MKNIIYVLLSFLIVGCNAPDREEQPSNPSSPLFKKIVVDGPTKLTDKVVQGYEGSVELDGCIFYVFDAYANDVTYTHAEGKCTNPIHHCKCN